MTLAELIAEVYVLTGRPDKVAETAACVRKATLKMHSVDFFYRDLQEIVVSFTTPAYKQQYDLGANIPGYRAINYIREWNSVPLGSEIILSAIPPDAILNEYGTEATDVWYVAGNQLNSKSSKLLTNVVLSYYKHPNITTNLYSSWIATEQPYAIIEEAAANLFQMIGHAEMRQTYERLSIANMAMLRQNYLEMQAR